MSEFMEPITAMGRLMGFTKHWNPFKNEIFALVELESEVIKLPIDYRQLKYVQKEHPVNSLVPLTYSEDRWQISSDTVTETWEFKDPNSVYS